MDIVATALNRADLLQRQGFYPAPWPKPAHEIPGSSSRPGGGGGRRVAGWAAGRRGDGRHRRRLPSPSGPPSTSASCWPVPRRSGGRRGRHPRGLDHRLGRAGRAGRADVREARRWSTPVDRAWARPPSRSPGHRRPGGGERARPARSSGAWPSAPMAVDHRRGDYVEACRSATGGRGSMSSSTWVGGEYVERNCVDPARRHASCRWARWATARPASPSASY